MDRRTFVASIASTTVGFTGCIGVSSDGTQSPDDDGTTDAAGSEASSGSDDSDDETSGEAGSESSTSSSDDSGVPDDYEGRFKHAGRGGAVTASDVVGGFEGDDFAYSLSVENTIESDVVVELQEVKFFSETDEYLGFASLRHSGEAVEPGESAQFQGETSVYEKPDESEIDYFVLFYDTSAAN